ncbi:MAG: undecaprenyl-phosphate alpha-N-acetylglucosaminyl 1-phosphate transferase, partial [Endozoicomonadaceae bacterium]|nr:undecaprenyl-phosphate alpha-N-acetylglucosaminyl 1-phosphate transferase [Endozoicomonadaceae bacterium]
MEYFLSFFASFALTACAVTVLQPISQRFGLVDAPNARKIHVGQIPLIGGVAIFLGVLAVSSMEIPSSQSFNLYLISAAFILFLGVLDDKYDLSVRLRIVAQILIA